MGASRPIPRLSVDEYLATERVAEVRHEYVMARPSLVVEVLSPSTATTDRREKRLGHQTLESLEEYVLIHQDRVAVDVYRRQDGRWSVIEHSPGERIALRCVSADVAVEELYRGTGTGQTIG